MDPVYPWVDASEVGRLARLLMSPVSPPSSVPGDAGFGEQFVGYALGQADVAAPVSYPAPEVHHEPVVHHEPEAQYEPEVPEPVMAVAPEQPSGHPAAEEEPVRVESEASGENGGRGPFLERFGRFREWMRKHFSCAGLFLLDRNGAVISDDTGYSRLHTAARNLAHAARPPGAATSNVHMKIGASLTMEVVPVDTPYGLLVLGVLVPHPLVPDAVAAVVSAIRLVAMPPGNGES
jgi:hypothetical protein